jgi:hypothetical protein
MGISLALLPSLLFSQTGTVADFQKISSLDGGLQGSLANDGQFGYVMESNQPNRLFAAAPFSGNGEFYIIDLGTEGEVIGEQKISSNEFDYFNEIENAEFGSSVVDIGDLNADGMNELIVGAPGLDGGALFLLQSNQNSYELSELGLPTTVLDESERLGEFLVFNEGILYAASAASEGAIYRLGIDIFEGAILLETIDAEHPLLSEKLEEGDLFGSGLSLTDLNQDGVLDIICGAPGDDDQGSNFGAVYCLLASEEETVSEVKKISRLEGDFGGFLNVDDQFGISVRAIGDLDENGAIDLAVGAPGDDDGGSDIGSVWILFLHPDGWVINERKINRFEGNFTFDLNTDDRLASRIATLGDMNGDGTIDIAVGAPGDDDGGPNRGAFYSIFIEQCPAPSGDFDFEVNGATVSFFAEGGEGYSYIWNFDDGGFSESQNPVHTYQNTGTYMVCLAINNECGGDNFCENVQVTSILSDQFETTEELTLYPNPVRDRLFVKGINAEMDYKVTDITGKVVLADQLNGINYVETSTLRKGIYLIEFISGSDRVVKKIQVVN